MAVQRLESQPIITESIAQLSLDVVAVLIGNYIPICDP